MSTSYNKKRKASRRRLDGLNPERCRIRNMIRTGRLPRYTVIVLPKDKVRTVGRELCRLLMASTFNVLTKADTEAAKEKQAK